MDIERPHRTTSTPTTTSELFICFTSRLSKSSSMRLSSKSILSPGRTATSITAADKSSHSLSLSSSLSRRLRHNGSLRGGAQSPAMFPSSSKKNKGSSGFTDNPEPSSPKVTCIGQVRVKTKKQGKKMKMRACRSKRLSGGGGGGGVGGGANGSGGEASFRRIEHSHSHSLEGIQNQQSQQECGLNHRNQRWVHLPLTICEALRAFGSEFSCLFPCKSSCFRSGGFCGGGERGGKTGEERENPSPNSCAVFRWLVSLQEGEGEEKRRDIELVVGGEEERDNRVVMMERECSRRRSIFDDMEFDDLFTDNNNVKNDNEEIIDNDNKNGGVYDDEGEDGRRRSSVCVPPKNALLLMRCRSDPLKMASLSRKLWEVPLPPQDDDDDVDVDVDVEVDVEVEERIKVEEIGVEREAELVEKTEEVRDGETEEIGDVETEEIGEEKTEEFREENNEIIGNEMEDFVEGSEEIDGVLENFEDSMGFAGEELKETEEKQSIENRGMIDGEEFEDSVETQLIEDDITASGCSIGTMIVEEMVEDGDNEQDLVINSDEYEQHLVINSEENANNLEENEQELKVEEEIEIERAELELDSDDLSTVQEEEERERGGESSEISTSFSCLNSSEESTAESKEREDEEQHHHQQEEKDPVKIDVEEEQHEQELVARKSIEKENKKTLPDCLLLMMCEPKVSMEVSKETWVCSTDFMRWLPERHPKKVINNKIDASAESTTVPKKNKPAAVAAMPQNNVQQRYEQAAQPPVQPGRSSISFPAGGGSVANLIEQKLNKGGGYEPFVLTRCKSAPLRSAAKTLPPEMACSLWGRENGRKLEPHRPATFGVGAAGVGF